MARCTKTLTLMLCLVLALPAWAQDEEVPTIPPPSDDAAVWYLSAMLMVEMWEGTEGPDDYMNRLFAEHEAFDPEEAAAILERFEPAIHFTRVGGTMQRCTWPRMVEHDGPPDLPYNLLGQMRRLGRILSGSAAMNALQGNTAQAIEDYAAILRLSRHSAASQSYISTLIQFSIESITYYGLAEYLDCFDREALITLNQALAQRPERMTVRQAVPSERYWSTWLRDLHQEAGLEGLNEKLAEILESRYTDVTVVFESDEQFEQWVDELDAAYDEVERLFALPPVEFRPARNAYEQQIEAGDNALLKMLIPSLMSGYINEYRVASMEAMARAMIAYRLNGREAFDAVLDPYDGEPFRLEVTDEGVVVSSNNLIRDDERWSLTFPAACAQPLEQE